MNTFSHCSTGAPRHTLSDRFAWEGAHDANMADPADDVPIQFDLRALGSFGPGSYPLLIAWWEAFAALELATTGVGAIPRGTSGTPRRG